MSHRKSPQKRLQYVMVSVRADTLRIMQDLADAEDISRARAGRLLILRGIEAMEKETGTSA